MKNILQSVNRKFLPGHLFYDPQWLVLGVNNMCNLHCKMCDVGTKTNDTNFAVNLVGTHPMNMPPELFRRIADQAKLYFPGVKLGYAFTEPLIYPHLEETLHYAQQQELFTAITTNALNLPQKAEILAKNGLNELFISLDGPQEIHNATRGHKSSFQRALDGIEKLLALRTIPVSVFCVITEWNIGYLQDFLNELSHLPLQHVGFLHANFVSEDNAFQHNLLFGNRFSATSSNIEEVNFSAYDLPLLEQELQEIKNKQYPFPVSIHPAIVSLDDLERYYHRPQEKVGKTCLDVFHNLMIKSDGSVIPAHGRCYNVSVGNIYTESLKEIWNATGMKELRKTLQQNGGLLPACTRCCSAVG
jgi:Fe-coproporphyrin III synthase